MKFDRTALNKLFHYCLALCGQRDDAYDLLQDSLEKYLSKSGSLVSNPHAFIKRIARNRFFDLQRRKKLSNLMCWKVLTRLSVTRKIWSRYWLTS